MGCFENDIRELSDRMKQLSSIMKDITAANRQVDTDIHMVSDSIDIMADTTDSLSDYTSYLKEKSDELRDASKTGKENLPEIADSICELIEECNSLLFGFVEMSHEIQNVVRSIADDVDEVYEAMEEAAGTMEEMVQESFT